MKTLRHDLTLQAMQLVNVILMTVPFTICWFGYYAGKSVLPMSRTTMWLPVLAFVVLYIILGRVYDAFLVSQNPVPEMVYSQSLAALITDVIEFILIWIMLQHFPNVLPGLAALVVQVLLAAIWSVLAHRWYFRFFGKKTTAVIYDDRGGMDRLIEEYALNNKYDVKHNLSVEECLDDLSLLNGLDTVFLSGVHSHKRNIILKYCVEHDVTMFVIPRVGDTIMRGAKLERMLNLPILRIGRYHPTPQFLFFKRLFDIISSSIVAIIASPIMLITAIVIKMDGGPVLYKQTRLTQDGREFKVLKFRSMCVDAEKDCVARLSTRNNDDRITKIGRIIRKVRIDELPQLFNIIAGSMSVVGPRPERPEIAALYQETIPEFNLRLQVKAGLTGLAQVYGKYNTTPYDKLLMDLMYIAKPSLLEDLRIIFATIKILFMPESTEGVAEGQMTAMGQNIQDSSENGVIADHIVQ